MNSTPKEQKTVTEKVEKIVKNFVDSDAKIRPHFTLTGPTGSGKSYIVQTVAEKFDIPFIEINAAQLTTEGTSGNSLSKALSPLLDNEDQPCVCFIDEFDKLFSSGNASKGAAAETTQGVQNELLTALESDTTSVFGDYGKYVKANTSNVLFVFAGAFNGEKDVDLNKLKEYGVRSEFLGRVSLVYSLKKLSLSSVLAIVEKSELLESYTSLLGCSAAQVKTAKKEVKKLIEDQYRTTPIGMRIVNKAVHQYFIDAVD